ncbi:MAG: hypothetical protein ACYC59_08525 [Anaerolineaceae bacterium]
MITAEKIQICEKENIGGLNQDLSKEDVELLVGWLSEKDDNFRYKCFLLLIERSEKYQDVYPFWDIFVQKLHDSNSYQRNIGLRMIANNVRWDEQGKFDAICDLYLSCCDDEKPVTVRQCIQGLCQIVPFNTRCHSKVTQKLLSIDIAQRKETQRKILLLDIISVLVLINHANPNNDILVYIQNALTGEILDKKSKQAIGAQLRN